MIAPQQPSNERHGEQHHPGLAHDLAWSTRTGGETLCPPAGAVSPFRGRLPCSLPSRKPIGAQLARRAFSAAVAPVVANRAVAQIAAVGFLDQKSHEPLPAGL